MGDRRAGDAALSHDDRAVVRLNGERVHAAGERVGRALLDHARVPVTLREGENALLMRVSQTDNDWEAAARLLPAEVNVDAPLLDAALAAPNASGPEMIPTLTVAALDADGAVPETFAVDGGRPMRNWVRRMR